MAKHNTQFQKMMATQCTVEYQWFTPVDRMADWEGRLTATVQSIVPHNTSPGKDQNSKYVFN